MGPDRPRFTSFASIAIIAMFLTGCSLTNRTPPPPPVIVTQLVAPDPPKQLYDCDRHTLVIPDANTLTNGDIGGFATSAQEIINECRSDARGMRTYITTSQKNIAESNKKALAK